MPDDLLEDARQRAEKAEPSVRAAALLRIARVESGIDGARARKTLLEGIDAVQNLPSSRREHLLEEARRVAAAVSPELLAEIPVIWHGGPEPFASDGIVHTMLTHGHLDAAFDYLLHYEDSASFPFSSIGNVLQQLNQHAPKDAVRRMILLRRAAETWGQGSSGHHHERDHFVRVFGNFWKEFPPEEAFDVARMIVAHAAKQPDDGITAGYSNKVQFTSCRQHILFQILHVLRHLDPALAQSLIDSHDQLAAAAQRYPNGLETLHEEAQAEVERLKAEGTALGGHRAGCVLTGAPKDFDRQIRLIDATRSGNFEPSLKDAIEKYQEDTSPAARNYAPKEYWPSTGIFRTIFYTAGRCLGPEAVKLLERVPDDDLRLFAAIELAAALAGAPESWITKLKQPRPLDSPGNKAG